ncbi:MAG: hypothetical protein IPO67_00615 [Deltaproteobacteria bacterium]|nr:hypothetical protein [Deltaproteobacteria bacterium]
MVLTACTPRRVCEGKDNERAVDDDGLMGCSPDGPGCDCTSGWPVSREGHEGEEDRGDRAWLTTFCASWVEVEARCRLGRCVGVEVGDEP